jgi:prepilin-type N-terminal cleavage/methylation domain-containing protein
VKRLITYKLKGFTLAEVMVTLVLTTIVVTFAYGTLSYVQKLFYSFKGQNRFIQEFTCFKQRMDHEALYAEWIKEQGENKFEIKRDSIITHLEILEHVILMKRGLATDTFHMEAKAIKKEYEVMPVAGTSNRLIKGLYFKTEFSKQAFNFQIKKKHDASVKLNIGKL